MAGLLYYLPRGGGGVLSLKDIREAGLGHAFQREPTCRGCQSGPGGAPGHVLGDSKRIDPQRIGYWPDNQTWRQIPGGPAWVGRWTDEPVVPADVARDEMLPGHRVTLADGHRWLVPAVRLAGELEGSPVLIEALPREMDLDEAGDLMAGQIVAEYRGIWQAASRYFEAMVTAAQAAQEEGQETVSLTIDDRDAIRVLAGNYRVTPVEVVLLGLLRVNSNHAREILDAAIDLQGFLAIKKKQDSVTPSTGSGQQDGQGVIAPPSLTSGP